MQIQFLETHATPISHELRAVVADVLAVASEVGGHHAADGVAEVLERWF